MEELNTEPVKQKSKGRAVVLVLLCLLLGGSAAANFWLWNKEKTATAIATSKLDSLKSVNLLKDSLYNMLAAEEASIASLRTEIALYQSENDSLKQILAEKESKIASLRAQIGGGGGSKKLRALKDSISRMAMENTEFKSKLQTLLLENEEYRKQLALKEETINSLSSSNEQLTNKVTIGAEPSVGPVSVVPMYTKKGIQTPIYKAKKVEKLVISFDVLDNKLTDKKIEKTYTVRVIDPDKIVLSKDTKTLRNSEDVFTIEEKVTFDGTAKNIKKNYTQEGGFKKGKYNVELKDGDEVKHKFSFDLL
ncbi:MAG: hypothetical protein V4613_01240 [Bacteroidota bacterium]